MADVERLPEAAGKATRGMRWAAITALVAVSATVGVAAIAEPHGGPGGPGMGGPGMLFMGPPEHIARHVDHLLDGLQATDAQRTQIKQIAQAAAADLKLQHDAGKALHDRSLQIFTAPNVDANAAESVRQQMLAQHDQTTRRELQAMLDVSRVLTPDQRAKIADRVKQHDEQMQERMERMKSSMQNERPQS